MHTVIVLNCKKLAGTRTTGNLNLKAGPEAVALPSADSSTEVKSVKVEEVDADLEDLKRSIDKL